MPPATAHPPPPRAACWPHIQAQRCTGCGRCVAACSPRVLSLHAVQFKKTAVLHDAPRCTGCTLCMLRCPFDAIVMQPSTAGGPPGNGWHPGSPVDGAAPAGQLAAQPVHQP